MTSPGLLILALVVAIAVILFCIIVLKLNAAIGMVIACLVMGVMGGLDLLTTTSTIASGFGNMMTSIGLPVGFGTILGQLMNDSGAAEVIADKIVSAFPAKKAIWGLSIAGFILSIPVFFDVTFIILIPIGITIASKIDLKMGYVTGCLTIGATTAHCVVPPTPNPLAAADIFGFDLGIMLIVGLIVGFITVMVSNFIYIKIHDLGMRKRMSIIAQMLQKNWLQLVKEERVRKIESRNRLCLFHFFQSSFRLFVFCLVQSVEPYLQRNL